MMTFLLALNVLLAVSVSSTVASTGDGLVSRRLRGGGLSAHETLPEETIQLFKTELGLKTEYELLFQKIEPFGDFEINGETFTFADLTPFSVKSEKMTTMMVDDEEIPVETGAPMFLGESAVTGMSFLVMTDHEGKIKDIEATTVDELTITVTEVFETGVYATIPPDAWDSDVTGQHIDGRALAKGLIDFQQDTLEDEGGELMDPPMSPPQTLTDDRLDANGRNLQSTCSSYKTIEVAIAYDSSFCADFGGGSSSASKAEVERIVATASATYWRKPGLCVNLELVHLEGYCRSSSDPYNKGNIHSGCSGWGMMQFFKSYWNDNRKNVRRDAAHLFRSKRFIDYKSAAGCAWIGTICESSAYGVNDFTSFRTRSGRAYLFSHELGHTAGAFDGEGGIMSGRGNGDYFSQTSKNAMNAKFAERSCVTGGSSRPPTTSLGRLLTLRSQEIPGHCFDLRHGDPSNGSRIWLYKCNGTPAQQWYHDNQNRLRSAIDPSKCVVGVKGSTENGTDLMVYDCFDNDERFVFDRYTDGTIRSRKNSRQCVDVSYSKTLEGNNRQVHWHECHGKINQKWSW